MKILQVMAGAPVGGAEGFYVDALKALSQTDVKQEALMRNNSDERVGQISNLNIPLYTASFDKNIYCTTSGKLRRRIKEFNPDIVHHWLARAASFAVEGRHVNVGWYGAYYDPKYYKNCRHHVAVTQDVADHIISRGVNSKNVHVLHIYSEYEPKAPVSRAALNTPENVPVLLSLARLHKVKGLDVLLEALVKIPQAHLWLAGSGPEEKNLKILTEKLGLQNRVRFLGWRNDREALLATSDIVVFPSRNDSFGAVILEAWASRTPLVAARAPGPRAYVTDKENGLLVNIDDAEGLADAIKSLLQDKDLQKHLIENGLKSYQKGFTKEVFQKSIIDLYEKILR